MHQAVISSGVRFKENDFPYNPHCTLKDAPPTKGDSEFERIDFPKFATIKCFSLYQPRPYGGKRIHMFESGRSLDGNQSC